MINKLYFVNYVLISVLTINGCKSRTSDPFSDRNGNGGRGGTVVICENKYPQMNNKRIMVTDLYELRTEKKKLGDVAVTVNGKDQLDYKTIAAQAIERLKFRDYKRYLEGKRLLYVADPMNHDKEGAEVAYGVMHLPNVGDEGAIVLPGEDCRLEYGAWQKKTDVEGKKLFNFRSTVWEQLDEVNKATLLVHEIMYNLYESNDAINARHMVQHIITDKLPERMIPFAKFLDKYSGQSSYTPAFTMEEIDAVGIDKFVPMMDGLFVLFVPIWDPYDTEAPRELANKGGIVRFMRSQDVEDKWSLDGESFAEVVLDANNKLAAIRLGTTDIGRKYDVQLAWDKNSQQLIEVPSAEKAD